MKRFFAALMQAGCCSCCRYWVRSYIKDCADSRVSVLKKLKIQAAIESAVEF